MTITSASTGINAANQGITAASDDATVTVTNYANISSGATANGSTLAGIIAGFSGTFGLVSAHANTSVNGTVLVDNFGNITAAKSYGIDAYNWGNGNVTVIEEAGTSVQAGTSTNAAIGIAAFGLGGQLGQVATGDVAVTVGSNATVTAVSAASGSGFGIEAYSYDVGNVSVTTGDNDVVTSASIGIQVIDAATSISSVYSVNVNVGADTIQANSGAGINAGYTPGGASSISNNVHGNVRACDQ